MHSFLTFARIVATFSPTSTNENVRNVFNVSSIAIHCLAQRIIYNWHRYLLQHTGQWTIYVGEEEKEMSEILLVFIVFFSLLFYW